MKLEQSFEIAAPVDAVWRLLNDVERVAPCLPGAAITERDEEGAYHGTFQLKLGPTTAAYRGVVRIEEADEAGRVATLKAKGTDKRGQGGASATIVNTLTEIPTGTRVDTVTDFTITGKLARFGRGGMIEDISNRMLREFADCLQKKLAAEQAAVQAEHAANGGSDASAGGAAAGASAGAAAGAAGGADGADSVIPSPSPPRDEPAAPLSATSVLAGALSDRLRRSPAAIAALFAAIGALVVLLGHRLRR